MSGEYRKDESGRTWWCNIHERRATYVFCRQLNTQIRIEHVCEPGLGGIMIPCRCVDLTDLLEIEGAV